MLIERFSTHGQERYRIVSAENPCIVINDAQGYGFKSYEKAVAFLRREKVVTLQPQQENASLPLF